ncbi:MAG: hypothetical protein AT710_09560 [Thermocladium sp. ECH_B]|nr:MAG: hypothetical protein AT710_09560 [Thermocladium sp. ECH_B]
MVKAQSPGTHHLQAMFPLSASREFIKLASSPALKGEVCHSFYMHGGNLAIYGGDELEEITLLVMFLFF